MSSGSEIGCKLRQIRQARGKSLAVIAGRAGISIGYLSRLEHGQRALDRRSLIVALANALEVAPTELSDLAAAPPGDSDHAVPVNAVRVALLSVAMGQHHTELVPVDVLTARVNSLLNDQQHCRHDIVGARLPDLIIDLHAAASGHQDGEVLRLLVLLHIQGTQAWLRDVGAPLDLGWQAASVARQAAERLDDPIPLGIATFGTTHGLLAAGAFDVARYQLVSAPTRLRATDGEQLAGMLAFTSSLLAAAEGRRADVVAALDHAADLEAHPGEGNACGSDSARPTSRCGEWRVRWKPVTTRLPPPWPTPSIRP